MAALVGARDSALMAARSVRLLRTASPPLGCGGAAIGERCASTSTSTRHGKSRSRLKEVQRLLYQAEERYCANGVAPIPRVTLDHVKISYANSGGSGGQNKSVNTKVDMRFNVKTAQWLDDKVIDRIMQMEKHRITRDGEIIISSKKSKALKNNAEDAIAKLQVFSYQKKKLQAIIDAASYAPTPPSKETVKKIAELSALAEQKRLEKQKAELRKKLA